jgi:hypothetical protein
MLHIQKSGRNRGSSWKMLQWDKIEDNDLKKLTKEEALKRMRSKNNPAYLLWVSDTVRTRHSWRDDKIEEYSYNGATWGYDVVMVFDGKVDSVKATHIANDADYAYEVIDPDRFLTSDIRELRRKAKEGAVALMDANRIAEKNMERYKNALANMRTPDAEQLIPKFDEITEMYKNVTSKYAEKIAQYVQGDTPSYWRICDGWKNINDEYRRITEELVDIKTYKGNLAKFAFNAYKNFNTKVAAFEKLCQDYLEKIENQ